MDNRAKIMSCALERFAARGYDAVGVQEIADAAGITKPTLYHYFGSKRGLLDELLSSHFGQLLQTVEPAAAYAGDLPLTLNRLAAAYLGYAQAHPLFYRFQLWLWFAPPDSDAFQAVAPLNEAQQALLEKVFVRAVDDHGNMRGRHRAYAATFLGMVNTYIGLALQGYTQLSDDLVHRAVHQYMHGIFS